MMAMLLEFISTVWIRFWPVLDTIEPWWNTVFNVCWL